MFGLTKLHEIAAARGDGLRPEFLGVVRRREALIEAQPKVTDIASHRDSCAVQAGPYPASDAPALLPAGVLAFPIRLNQNQAQQPSRRKL